jgi:hypothetical protein
MSKKANATVAAALLGLSILLIGAVPQARAERSEQFCKSCYDTCNRYRRLDIPACYNQCVRYGCQGRKKPGSRLPPGEVPY